ncbi:MAG TPA: hypothetical protein VI503_03565 [Gaiellaceae bacterium]|nr:hypothetical protein [Gaiellaceae bacterium]
MTPFPDLDSLDGVARERDVLGDRIESLAAWIREIDTRVRVAELATGDERTAKQLRKAVEALSDHDPDFERRLTEHVAVLSDRLETLAATVSTTAAAIAGKDGELSALRRELEIGQAHVEMLTAQLQRPAPATDVEGLRREVARIAAQRSSPSQDRMVEELGRRVDILSAKLESLDANVAASETARSDREIESETLRQEARQGLTEVLARVDLVEQRLETLGASVEETMTGFAEREKRLDSLRDRFETAGERVDTLVKDLQAALETMARSRPDDDASDRVDALTAEVDALRAELARTGSSSGDATGAQALLDGLRQRQAEAEREAALAGAGSLVARLDELAERLESLEQAEGRGPALEPVAGDGRFRAELRALELRLERAEAEARESRELLMEQIERLASRIDWRLQRLETSQTASPEHASTATGGGRVVAIRNVEP